MVYAVLVAALAHTPTSEESRKTGLRLLQDGYLPCSAFDTPSSVLDPSCECLPDPSNTFYNSVAAGTNTSLSRQAIYASYF